MTTDVQVDAHWPSIRNASIRKFLAMTKYQKWRYRPKCTYCNEQCWYSDTEHRWRHVRTTANPERFIHLGGERYGDWKDEVSSD